MALDIRTEINNYIEYLDLKEISKKSYRVILDILADYFEKHKIDEPTRTDLLNFKEEMLKKVSSASVQKYIVVTRGFFRHLQLQGRYEDISFGIRGLKVESTFKRMTLNLKDSIKLINKAKKRATTQIGKRDYALVVLILTTGIRSIEAQRANVDDIDYVEEKFVLHIQGKGRDTKAEYVKLSEETYNAIQDYIATIDQKKVVRENRQMPLFLTKEKGGEQSRLSTKGIRNAVKELLISIGYNSRAYSVHSLRHTFATLSLLEGATILQTKDALRHKNIATTQIYTHMVEGLQSDTNQLVSNALFNKSKKEKKKGS